MLTPEQLKERQNYLGASEAAAALGLSRWQTQLELWALKVGRIEPEDKSANLPIRMGNKLEQTVAELFTEETSKGVYRVNDTQYHKDHPFIACNIDRKVIGESALLECKTCSAWKAKEWAGEEIPQEYIIQVYHQLAVTGYEKGYIAVLIGGQDFRYKEIYRNDEIMGEIINKEVEFWNKFVIPKSMPMQITKDDGSTLYKLFPISDPNQDIILGDEANILIEQITSMTADLLSLEERIEANRNQIKALLGEAESGRTNNYRITWKLRHTNRVDVDRFKKENEELYKAYIKTSSSRVLLYKELEKK